MKQINKLRFIVVTLALTLVSDLGYSQSYSSDISELELQGLVANLGDEVVKLDTLDSVTEINQYLSSFQPIVQTVLTHLWLQQLSYQQEVSPQHLIWVQSLTSSQTKLLSRLTDHPQKQIAIVNIAEQARSVLKINHIKHLVGKIEQQWMAGQFIWINWLTGDPERHAALVNWLILQDQNIEDIKQSFVINTRAEQWPNNRILAVLIGKSPTADLLSLLWQVDVDEYSYQTIHALPKIKDDSLVVTYLIEAMKVKQLTSQALLSLATHYPHNETAQKAIETSLGKTDQQWYALMALDKMDAPEFKKDLLLKLAQRQTPFAGSASKILARQIANAESKELR